MGTRTLLGKIEQKMFAVELFDLFGLYGVQQKI